MRAWPSFAPRRCPPTTRSSDDPRWISGSFVGELSLGRGIFAQDSRSAGDPRRRGGESSDRGASSRRIVVRRGVFGIVAADLRIAEHLRGGSSFDVGFSASWRRIFAYRWIVVEASGRFTARRDVSITMPKTLRETRISLGTRILCPGTAFREDAMAPWPWAIATGGGPGRPRRWPRSPSRSRG
jgi:hypothetical protein